MSPLSPAALLRGACLAALLVAAPQAWAQEAHGEAEAEAPAAEAALPAITVSEVRALPLTDRVIASGLVDAVEEVAVQPLVEGQPIDELLADVGDTVTEGQVLARLSTSTLELQLSQLAANRATAEASITQAEASLVEARASAEEAQRVANRTAELAEAGSVSSAQRDQAEAAAVQAQARLRVAEQGIASAQAQLELADAQIANAELQLSRTEVKAPVAGLVVARNAQVGAIASSAAGPMFTLVRDGAMELRADVSEQDLLKLRPGQAARLSAVQGSAPIPGEVRLVEPAIDPQTRLGVARVQIDDPSRVVKGMFLTAEVIVDEQEMMAVPVTAVGQGPDGATVMRVRDGVAERVSVTVGIRDGGLIGITEGLEAGDQVVTKAGAFVRDGDRINPIPAEMETASATPAQGE
ncbi:efflux RND transporter periplasmic adaptor subunit [Rubellimicrobium roseum]|uniref:Efflux RND transporter periplasmic adaptor subunit n=1 Tax=Rubellimicrobium roseum TaxID=687525 RepID=A0A5C4N8X6_9RHOB|nr:efflux RND transporter periplasmic adaptor subunit [Rubellimicrobium roseum]TNC59174.1 efflux RND transporter periplasmic adaptor subunit [Rubellimicrobium roseum]